MHKQKIEELQSELEKKNQQITELLKLSEEQTQHGLEDKMALVELRGKTMLEMEIQAAEKIRKVLMNEFPLFSFCNAQRGHGNDGRRIIGSGGSGRNRPLDQCASRRAELAAEHAAGRHQVAREGAAEREDRAGQDGEHEQRVRRAASRNDRENQQNGGRRR